MTNVRNLETKRDGVQIRKAKEEYEATIQPYLLTKNECDSLYRLLAESNKHRQEIFGSAVKPACLCCNEKRKLSYTPQARWYKCENCNGFMSAELISTSEKRRINGHLSG